MSIDTVFNIVVVIFTVANLFAGGLECDLKEALSSLRSPKLIVPTLFWGWVIGPALALLILLVLPLSEGHAAGLILVSLAPIAPFLPIAVLKARGDKAYSVAYILLTTILTVVLMPLLAPWLIKGLTLNAWALAKPLILLVLLPLLIGVAMRTYKAPLAAKLFPAVKKTGGLFLLICLAMVLWLYSLPYRSSVLMTAPSGRSPGRSTR